MARTPSPARETRALPRPTPCTAFTLIEVVIVMAIILVLAGLILATSGYVQNKGRRSRAEAEIAAISAALENYKADNGIYPTDTYINALDARTTYDPASYQTASLALYKLLSSDANANRTIDGTEANKSYFAFKPNQLSPQDQSTAVVYVRDPFGNSYGYSTAGNSQTNPSPSSPVGYNPTYDLWSTADYSPSPAPSPTPTPQDHWVKNW